MAYSIINLSLKLFLCMKHDFFDTKDIFSTFLLANDVNVDKIHYSHNHKIALKAMCLRVISLSNFRVPVILC